MDRDSRKGRTGERREERGRRWRGAQTLKPTNQCVCDRQGQFTRKPTWELAPRLKGLLGTGDSQFHISISPYGREVGQSNGGACSSRGKEHVQFRSLCNQQVWDKLQGTHNYIAPTNYTQHTHSQTTCIYTRFSEVSEQFT